MFKMAESAENGKETLKQENKDEKVSVQGTKQKNAQIDEKQTKELTETLQRLQAEFENYQKRSLKQNAEFMALANASLMEQLLPVLDTLDNAMKHNKEFVLVHEQLLGVLRKNGLGKIHAQKGMHFNHDKMECLMQEHDPSLKEGAVVNVLLEGYELNGKVLRAAKVSVNALEKKEETKNDEMKKGETCKK